MEYLLAVLAPTAAAVLAWSVLQFAPVPSSSLLVLIALALLAYELPPQPLRVAYMVGLVAILLPLMAPSTAAVAAEAAVVRWVGFAGVSGIVMYLLSRLHRQHVRLNDLDQRKATFIALANHELRTPVSVMHASLDILNGELAGRLTREEDAFLQAARASASSLVHLVEMLTHFEALQRAPRPGHGQQPPLERTVNATVSSLHQLFEQQAVDLQVDLDPQAAARRVPETYARIILEHLLGNAAKFNSPGGHASLRARVDDDRLVLEVADDGWGIPIAAHDTIFESFYQPGNVTNRLTGGLGLGLALVKVAVQRLDGSIEVKSKPGEGSTFTVCLPATSSTYNSNNSRNSKNSKNSGNSRHRG